MFDVVILFWRQDSVTRFRAARKFVPLVKIMFVGYKLQLAASVELSSDGDVYL